MEHCHILILAGFRSDGKEDLMLHRDQTGEMDVIVKTVRELAEGTGDLQGGRHKIMSWYTRSIFPETALL